MEVVYQGVPGAFAEEAAEALAPTLPRRALPRLDEVFDAVAAGARAVVPIENTLAGSVQPVQDQLAVRDVRVIGEGVLRVSHALVGAPGATLDGVRRVHSHPVALAQCERFFAAHPSIEPVAAYNTAGAIADVVARGDVAEAAIGSKRAAERYGGVVLAAPLEDEPENYTRFLLLAREDEPHRGRRKASLIFTLAHRPGSLVSALAAFSSRGLDLTKIESRPLRGRPFEYAFHADVVFTDDAPLDAAIAELRASAHAVRELGRYPLAAP